MRLFLNVAGAAWFILAGMMTLALARAARRAVPVCSFSPADELPPAALPKPAPIPGESDAPATDAQMKLLE